MASEQQHKSSSSNEGPQRVTGTSVLYASLAAVSMGVPLLGMTGLSFVASVTVLLLTSPLLIVFSPVLISAAWVLAVAMAGFAAAAAMALAGLTALSWVARVAMGSAKAGIDELVEGIMKNDEILLMMKMTESDQNVKELAGNEQHSVQVNPPPSDENSNKVVNQSN